MKRIKTFLAVAALALFFTGSAQTCAVSYDDQRPFSDTLTVVVAVSGVSLPATLSYEFRKKDEFPSLVIDSKTITSETGNKLALTVEPDQDYELFLSLNNWQTSQVFSFKTQALTGVAEIPQESLTVLVNNQAVKMLAGATCIIHNLMGQEIARQKVDGNQATVTVACAGSYFITVLDANGAKTQTKQIVLVK